MGFGVKLQRRGRVVTFGESDLRTAEPGVWLLGDPRAMPGADLRLAAGQRMTGREQQGSRSNNGVG